MEFHDTDTFIEMQTGYTGPYENCLSQLTCHLVVVKSRMACQRLSNCTHVHFKSEGTMSRILKGNRASSWIEHIYRLHSPPWCFLRPLIRTRRIEISVMAFLWQVKDKATIFQSISPGNMLINHQRLGLCYSDCKKESSVVSVWVKWDSLLLNTFGYHQGLVASTSDSFGLKGLSWSTAILPTMQMVQSGIKAIWNVFGDANFLNPTRGLPKLRVFIFL